MSKKFSANFLILICLILNMSSVFGQDNISQNVSVIKTSYVSGWEKLNAINDGYEPENSGDKGPGAYGNWNQTSEYNKWNWVEYDFNNYYLITESSVYWWTDGGGIQIPYETYIEYYNILSEKWENPQNIKGNGVEPDKYNVTSFNPIITNKVRISFISIAAQGILEWKLFGYIAEGVPVFSIVTIDNPLSGGNKSIITAKAIDSKGKPVSNYKFQITVQVDDYLDGEKEEILYNDSLLGKGFTIIEAAPTDINGVTEFKISIPEDIDPKDGVEVIVKYNEGFAEIAKFCYYAEGLEAPELIADNTANNVDNPIDISFSEVQRWKENIYGIKINDTLLTASDFEINDKYIRFFPSNGNKLLTKAGDKNIVIESMGFNNSTIVQHINAGSVSTLNSYIDINSKIYRQSITTVTAYAYDKYNNPVSGYTFCYDIEVVNNSKDIDEIYSLENLEITKSSFNNLLAETDIFGKTTLKVKVPFEIDLNDGILLQLKYNDSTTTIGESFGYKRTENEKTVYVPSDLKRTKEFSWDYTAQSENFVAFWGAKSGSDPLNPTSGDMKFDPQDVLENLESYYSFYIDSMKFITNPDSGNMGKYKFVVILFNTWNSGYSDNGAYGGSVDGVIGAMWMNPQTGFVIAHEFGHACQAMVPIQYPGKGFKNISDNHQVGMYWEACANYMAYLSTGQLANSLSPLFVNTSMLQYLSTINWRQYEFIYFPAYIIDKYGIGGLGKQWRAADIGDNPFDAMMKGFGMTRDEMRREAGLWAMHNVTWDYSIGDEVRSYLKSLDHSAVSREYTYLDALPEMPGKYIVPREMAPADYGYNIIPLFPDENAIYISAKLTGYENNSAKGGGWSYGIVAVDNNGNPRYSDVYIETDEKATFNIEKNDSLFYLVVLASPCQTNTYAWTPPWPKVYRFPYLLEFSNAVPAGHMNGYNSKKNKIAGAPHQNGGGWVASTAHADASSFVGPYAQVLGNSKVLANARIEDHAQIIDNAIINKNAIVRGNAIVGKAANVTDNSIVEKSARVWGGKISGNGVVTGSAVTFDCRISENAVVKDVAWLTNMSLSGDIIVGGDKIRGDEENFSSCNGGIYLSLTQTKCDKKLWDTKNEDANQIVDHYYYPFGDIPLAPDNLSATVLADNSVLLTWDEAPDNGKIFNYIIFCNEKPLKTANGICDTITNLNSGNDYYFKLRARDNVGNISEYSEEVKIKTTVANHTYDRSKGVKIIPNPVRDNFQVVLNGNEEGKVVIADMLGRVVFNEAFHNSIILEKEKVGGSGFYLVKVETKTGVFISKMTIR